MKTEYKKLNLADDSANHAIFKQAAEIIRNGGLVAFPTETVYGLGVDAFNPTAARKIYEAKGRPADNPLIVHIMSVEGLKMAVSEVSTTAEKLIEAFWPGPLTLILPKKKEIPAEITGGLETVAVRFPYNKAARKLIEMAGVPIAAPSANTSGRPSPTSAEHVKHDMDGKIDMIIDGGDCEHGIESTIVDVTSEEPQILRPGSITAGMIEEVLGSGIIKRGSSGESEINRKDETPKAPGMKYTHYSPLARLTVVRGEFGAVVMEINRLCEKSSLPGVKIGIFATEETKDLYPKGIVLNAGQRANPETIARNLFWALRRFDYLGVTEIYSEAFYETELGRSVMNRLEKASGNNILLV